MNPEVTLRLERALPLLVGRLARLEDRLRQGDETAWAEYCRALDTLTNVLDQLAPGRRGSLLTTQEMAELFGIAPKTLLRRKARGEIRPAAQLGKRGRAANRWRGDELLGQ